MSMAPVSVGVDDDEAHVVFAQDARGALVLTSIHASAEVRGRAMLQWLRAEYGRPIHVYEVAYPAIGFWNRMRGWWPDGRSTNPGRVRTRAPVPTKSRRPGLVAEELSGPMM